MNRIDNILLIYFCSAFSLKAGQPRLNPNMFSRYLLLKRGPTCWIPAETIRQGSGIRPLKRKGWSAASNRALTSHVDALFVHHVKISTSLFFLVLLTAVWTQRSTTRSRWMSVPGSGGSYGDLCAWPEIYLVASQWFSVCECYTSAISQRSTLSPCSVTATTCKPQEICGPTLASHWTLPPLTPHPSALATRVTCALSAPSVRLAASARWVHKARTALRNTDRLK